MSAEADDRPSGKVVVDGVRLAYRVDGPDGAPAVLFANSLGLDLRMWQPQVARFVDCFRVIRYDARGHGRSDVPPGPYMLDRLGNDALAILNALGIERAHICGISLGGMVALWLAVNHPERVDRAIFANTGPRIGTEASWDDRIATVRAGGMPSICEMVVNRFLSAAFRARHPEVAQRIGDMLIATCEALCAADLRGVVGGIGVPSLILASGLDEPTPPALSHDLHAAITGSELVIFPNAAHLTNVEQADAFSSHVLALLDAASRQ